MWATAYVSMELQGCWLGPVGLICGAWFPNNQHREYWHWALDHKFPVH